MKVEFQLTHDFEFEVFARFVNELVEARRKRDAELERRHDALVRGLEQTL